MDKPKKDCWGEMTSKGMNKNCNEECTKDELLSCWKETNRRLKKRGEISEEERKKWLSYQYGHVLKGCSLGAAGECE